VVNWQHGVQCIREQAQPSKKSLVAAVADLAEQLSTGAQCERQLGEVLCASVKGQEQDAQAAQVKAEQVAQVKDAWDRQVFHAAKVALKVKGSTDAAPTHAVGDTGAAPSLFPSNGLSVEVLRGSLRPGRAKLMHSASTHQITSRGGAALQFTLGDEDETEFRHEFQITEGGATPAILGVDFWAAHTAKFDFAERVIELQVNGKMVKVPFTIGDEDVDERVQAVYCAEDVVVPPRQAYMLKGIVGTERKRTATSAHEVWLVEARSEQEQEQLETSTEEAITRLQGVQDRARQTVQARQRLPGQKSKRGTREQRQGDTWGMRGAVGAEE